MFPFIKIPGWASKTVIVCKTDQKNAAQSNNNVVLEKITSAEENPSKWGT